MDLDKKIISFIKTYGKRIKINFLLDKILFGILLCGVLSFILLSVSVFVPFKDCYRVIAILCILIILGSFIYGILKLPNIKKIALLIDSKGLKERVITSLCLSNDNSDLAITQKKDTIEKLKNFNYKEKFPIKIDRKKLLKIGVLIVICTGILLVPSTSKTKAKELRNFEKGKSEIINKVEKEKNKIEKTDDLSKEEKEKLKKLLEDGKNELKDIETNKDINKFLERLNKKLETLKDEIKSEEGKKALENLSKELLEDSMKKLQNDALKDLNKINEALNKTEEGEKISEALNSGDKEALENQLNNLNNSLKNMSENEKIELAESLSELASSLSDEELQALMNQTSQGVMNGEIDPSELAKELSSLENTAKGNNNSNNENNNSNSGSGNNNSNSGNGNNSSANGGSSGNGSGNGNGSNGSGSGNGNGSENGNGSGTGWNTGSKNGTENTSEPTKGEEVYIPGREIGSDANLTGNKNNNSPSQAVETENGLNFSGEKKDYNEVIGDYSEKELEGIEGSSIPENMKDIVKDYFDGLN